MQLSLLKVLGGRHFHEIIAGYALSVKMRTGHLKLNVVIVYMRRENKMTEKEKAIRNIKQLYPPDSEFQDINKRGQELLFEAISNKWRELPDSIILEYERLCVIAENK